MLKRIKSAAQIFRIVSFALFTFGSLNAYAQSSASDAFRNSFIEFYKDPENYEKIVRSFQVSPRQEVILVDHMQKIFSNPLFINTMLDEMENQGILDMVSSGGASAEVLDMSMSFGYQFVTELSVKGVKRMSDERVRDFLKMTGVFFEKLEPRYCRALMGSSVSQKDEMMASISGMRKLNANELRFYLELNREAIFAELKDWPSSPVINDYQVNIGQKVFETAFTDAVENHPNSAGIVAALLQPHTARDQDFCVTGQVMMDIIYDLEGMAGNWFRRSFVQSM